MNDLTTKCMSVAGVEVKDPDRGEVEAVVARTGLVDRDGDVFLPGSFGTRNVRVSAYNHRSWPARGGLPPVGRGTIRERGNEVVADLRFFLSTADGREAFQVVKEMGELQQWSFGWVPGGETTAPVPGGFEGKARRAIRSVPVEEVSPVLLGASIGTRTVAAKCERCSTAPTPAPPAAKSPAAPRGPRNILMTDQAAVKLAAFAVGVGARLHDPSATTPAFGFFEPDGKHNGLCPAFPSVKGAYVRFSADLRGSDLIRVALHETRHLYQAETDLEAGLLAERERDAEAFAAKWTEPVLAAFNATKGRSADLHVTRDREPPFGVPGDFRSGDLVLSSAGRLWRYTPMQTRAWSAV